MLRYCNCAVVSLDIYYIDCSAAIDDRLYIDYNRLSVTFASVTDDR